MLLRKAVASTVIERFRGAAAEKGFYSFDLNTILPFLSYVVVVSVGLCICLLSIPQVNVDVPAQAICAV